MSISLMFKGNSTNKHSVLAQHYNPGPWRRQHPSLYSEFEDSLSYMTYYLKKENPNYRNRCEIEPSHPRERGDIMGGYDRGCCTRGIPTQNVGLSRNLLFYFIHMLVLSDYIYISVYPLCA